MIFSLTAYPRGRVSVLAATRQLATRLLAMFGVGAGSSILFMEAQLLADLRFTISNSYLQIMNKNTSYFYDLVWLACY